ncbi:MAG TPA: hypothetical protein VFP72_19935, partial [Kineosporiaceae bacterium]|nr:hypothetical protein [Kineosporiaceae bacterium]
MTELHDGLPRPSAPCAHPGEPSGPGGAGLRGRDWAGLGLVAGVAGIGAAQLVAAVVGPVSAPLVAAGSAFVDLTPPWLKDLAVSLFGTHDKQVLLAGAVVVLAAASAGAGVLARRRLRPAQWLVLGLGVVAALAAATRPQ